MTKKNKSGTSPANTRKSARTAKPRKKRRKPKTYSDSFTTEEATFAVAVKLSWGEVTEDIEVKIDCNGSIHGDAQTIDVLIEMLEKARENYLARNSSTKKWGSTSDPYLQYVGCVTGCGFHVWRVYAPAAGFPVLGMEMLGPLDLAGGRTLVEELMTNYRVNLYVYFENGVLVETLERARKNYLARTFAARRARLWAAT